MAKPSKQPADAGAEFDEFEETGAVQPEQPAPVGPRPLLALSTLTRTYETISIDGTIYDLRTTMDYSVGEQSYLIISRNTQLDLRQQESRGEQLAADQRALQRHLLDRITAAALPDLPAEGRGKLSDEQLEAVATLFFERSTALRERSNPAVRLTSDG